MNFNFLIKVLKLVQDKDYNNELVNLEYPFQKLIAHNFELMHNLHSKDKL